MKRVLIAHQSTIPHYRLHFYNTLHQLKPEDWEFEVVYDLGENKKKRFFSEPVDTKSFNFPILHTKTYSVKNGNSRVTFQTFVFKSSKYDLVIVEQALNNLSYPLVQTKNIFWKESSTIWGHGRQISAVNPSFDKRITEWLKL